VKGNVAIQDNAGVPLITPSRGTILLVSAAFPPWTEVGAARWEGFAPYLNAAGWSLSVLFEEPPADSAVDLARAARLGTGVTTHPVRRRSPAWRGAVLRAAAMFRTATTDDEATAKVSHTDVHTPADGVSLRAVHPRVFFGAAVNASRARMWIRDVIEISETLRDARDATIVVSSGPPHDAHVAASAIAARRRLPHVVDLRDPWVGNTAISTLGSGMFGGPVDAKAERRVLLAAAAIITNTPSAAAALAARHPEIAGRVYTVLNGSDRAPRPARALPDDAPYCIVHTGTLYLGRDPRPFLQAVAAVRTRLGPAHAGRLRVLFMGHPASIGGRRLGEWATDFGLDGCFEERPFGTRAEATAVMDTAAMLVAFQGATPTQVPAKVFDYVSNAATLLALTDPRTATAAVLEGTHALVAAIDDTDTITAHIEHAVSQAFAGVPIVPVDVDGRFARATQAEALEQILLALQPR